MIWKSYFIILCIIIFVHGKPRLANTGSESELHNSESVNKKQLETKADDTHDGRVRSKRRPENVARPRSRSTENGVETGQKPLDHENTFKQHQRVDGRRKPSSRKKWTSLAHSAACQDDIVNLCPTQSRSNNFLIIDCLEHDETTAEKVSPACQHAVWMFKRNVTFSSAFVVASHHVCDVDFKNITECSSNQLSEQQKLACFFEFKYRVKSAECLMFMNRIGTILFSDYHLIRKFADECGDDIQTHKCGRLVGRLTTGQGDDDKKDLPNSQGRTIECLLDKVDLLNQKCAHEIMRVAELQADDYHLDRPLFFACREDRDKLCREVRAGEGRVYKCLMKYATDRRMSTDCNKHLTKRMALRAKHYKVDYSFTGSCEAHIRQLKCVSEEDRSNVHQEGVARSVPIAKVILCLENAMKKNTYEVTPECMSEIFDIRKQMMSNYKISPEILLHCQVPIQNYCDNVIKQNGATIHCLMDQVKGKLGKSGLKEYPKCMTALKNLVKIADPSSDYRVDPVIGQACSSVIAASCSSVESHQGAVLSCLLNHMTDSTVMSNECSEKLLELQYILSRDFTLDARLYKGCHDDAVKLCKANSEWNDPNAPSSSHALIFSCLFRSMQARELTLEEEDEKDDEDEDEKRTPSKDNHNLLSKTCSFEVLRVLRERSSRIMLNPYVYDSCMPDLAKYCAQSSEGHHEMRCLQNHYEELKNDCKEVVRTYTTEQERHPSLDHIMAASCRPMITLFCAQEMRTDPGQIMPCLIRYKNHPDMNKKCQAGVEHHQIISLKDFRISHAFRRACSRDLGKFCTKAKKKSDAVECLSELIRNNTLLDKEVPLNKACRQQVRVENLQKSQDIRLSPRLAKACKEDIDTFCRGEPKSKQIQCLRRQKWSHLKPECRRIIFLRVRLESMDSRIDARLQRVCKSMIKHYCTGHEKDALDCLWKHIHDDNFDAKCRRVVYLRLETRARDYRLDPLITHLCKRDIRKHCRTVLDPRNNMTGSDYRGRVTSCLKEHYRNFELNSGCHGHIRQLIVETNLNHHMDPILRRACERDVQRLCATELEDSDREEGRDGDGSIVECLKKALTKAKIKSQECQKETLRLMEEGKADVHVDPLLYQACRHELGTICQNTPLGDGKQMACLLWAKDDREASKGMSYTCRKQVQLRAEMWEMAAKLAPPQTLQELGSQITSSTAKNYFFAFLATTVLAIFVFGLCCGRVTKRVRVDVKNK